MTVSKMVTGMRKCHWWIVIMLIAAGCGTQPAAPSDGPRLVGARTLPAQQARAENTTVADASTSGDSANQNAPQPASATPAITLTPTRGVTPEDISPMQQVTSDARFVVVTPTLPPSKTPTPTQTMSPTPTLTRTPTLTLTPGEEEISLPPPDIVPVEEEQVVAAPNNVVCETNWVDIQPRPDSCPLASPNASAGTYQIFEFGHMVHVANQDAIYVLYNDGQTPRWEVFRDNHVGDALNAAASEVQSGRWNPRRGFGLLWQQNPRVSDRIGYAVEKWEERFSLQVQTLRDGTIVIAGQNMNLGEGDRQPASIGFGLFPQGANWSLYNYRSLGDLPATTNTNNSGAQGEFSVVDP